jgi:hypothetical protein
MQAAVFAIFRLNYTNATELQHSSVGTNSEWPKG